MYMYIYIYIHIYVHIHRDPEPKDNSSIRKDTSTYEGGFVLRLRHCFLIKEFLLGLGSLCLLLNYVVGQDSYPNVSFYGFLKL